MCTGKRMISGMTTNANETAAPTIASLIEIGAPTGGTAADPDGRLFTPDEIAPAQPGADFADVADEGARMAGTPAQSHTYLTAQQREAIRAREGVTLARPLVVGQQPAPAPAPVVTRLSGADMVAGAAAAGEAVLVGWDGSGELTLAQIRERVAAAGLGVEILPSARTARAQLGRAVSDACGSKYDHKIEKATDEERPYAARWTISTSNPGAAVGQPSGYTVATVTLDKQGGLAFESGDAELEASIRAEYQRRVDAEVFNSADVTAWLRSTITATFGGVKLGGVYYVPRTGAAQAEALCASVATAWGANWIAPALPVATTDQLRRGLVAGLAAEAADVSRRFELARANAREEHAAGTRKASDLTARAAQTYLSELRTVAERCVAYGQLLGAELVAELRDRVVAAMESTIALLDATAQRAAQIWEEIEAERARGINREDAATRAHVEAA